VIQPKSLTDVWCPEFGIYVDKHGDLSRSANTIEWEGTAERVAFHSPHVLIFDTRFIEVRHIETGRLVQIIPGNDVRCIYDGRGVGNHVTATPMKDTGDEQEAQVHAVMNADSGGIGGSRPPPKAVAQRVVELIPTVPLYLPGSLSSPGRSTRSLGTAQSTYFSPPSSPEAMRQSHSWRP
jgi:RHO1 GDP-GTP exchange protein 1/2